MRRRPFLGASLGSALQWPRPPLPAGIADVSAPRRLPTIAAAAPAALGPPLAACTNDTAEAQRIAQEWFLSELQRIGYVAQADGVYGTPPKPVSGSLLGEALESQIRHLAVTEVRPAVLTEEDRARDVRWRGQVSLSYELREQYHKDGRPRGWSEWTRETSLLSLEHRGGQWYVTRIR